MSHLIMSLRVHSVIVYVNIRYYNRKYTRGMVGGERRRRIGAEIRATRWCGVEKTRSWMRMPNVLSVNEPGLWRSSLVGATEIHRCGRGM